MRSVHRLCHLIVSLIIEPQVVFLLLAVIFITVLVCKFTPIIGDRLIQWGDCSPC